MWSWQYPLAPMSLCDHLAEENTGAGSITRRGVIERIRDKVHAFGAPPMLEIAEVAAVSGTREISPSAAHGLARFEFAPLMERPATTGTPLIGP